jgi:hypothetical protein
MLMFYEWVLSIDDTTLAIICMPSSTSPLSSLRVCLYVNAWSTETQRGEIYWSQNPTGTLINDSPTIENSRYYLYLNSYSHGTYAYRCTIVNLTLFKLARASSVYGRACIRRTLLFFIHHHEYSACTSTVTWLHKYSLWFALCSHDFLFDNELFDVCSCACRCRVLKGDARDLAAWSVTRVLLACTWMWMINKRFTCSLVWSKRI